jgi:hypothetical protein
MMKSQDARTTNGASGPKQSPPAHALAKDDGHPEGNSPPAGRGAFSLEGRWGQGCEVAKSVGLC